MKTLKMLVMMAIFMMATSVYAGGMYGNVYTQYQGAYYLVSNAVIEVYFGNKLVAKTKSKLCGDYGVTVPVVSFEKFRVIVKGGTYMTRVVKPDGECGYDGFLGKFKGGEVYINVQPDGYNQVDIRVD